MTQKMRDNIITTIVNQGITFLILVIIFKMTAWGASKQEAKEERDKKLDKTEYYEDKEDHAELHESEKSTNEKTYEMVKFLYEDRITKGK